MKQKSLFASNEALLNSFLDDFVIGTSLEKIAKKLNAESASGDLGWRVLSKNALVSLKRREQSRIKAALMQRGLSQESIEVLFVGRAARNHISARNQSRRSWTAQPQRPARAKVSEVASQAVMCNKGSSQPPYEGKVSDQPCRWPIGNPDENDFHFCTANALINKPYCGEHCAVAFRKLPSKEKSREGQRVAV